MLAVRFLLASVLTIGLGGCGLFGGDDEVATSDAPSTTIEAAAEEPASAASVSTTSLPPFLDRGFPVELDRIESLDLGSAWKVLCLGRTFRLVGDSEMTELRTKLLGDHDVTDDQVASAIDRGCDDADGNPDLAIRMFMEDLEIDDEEMSVIIDKNCDQFARENNYSAEGIEYDAILGLATGASNEELSMSIVEACGAERFTG